MTGTPEPCARSTHPDTSFVLQREYEAGFLLPQFMGALASGASEVGASGMTDLCPQRSGTGLFARLMQSLKLRGLTEN